MDIKRIVITGASDGIGAEAARQLKQMGHQVVIVGRSPDKTARIAKELDSPYHLADFEKLSDVRRLADELKNYDRIDVLANNAGGLLNNRRITEDGFEVTFQVNLLAGFLLTQLLHDKFAESGATVIQTSSTATNSFGKEYDNKDLNTENGYSATKAYGNAKLETILFTRELERRWGSEGIHSVAFEPGVVRTNFAAQAPLMLRSVYHTPLKYFMTTPTEKSAGRLTRLAIGVPDVDFEAGMAYSNQDRFIVWCEDHIDAWGKDLWEQCETMLNLS